MVLLLLTSSSKCCTELARPQVWGLSCLLCLNFYWPASSFTLMWFSCNKIFPNFQVSAANLFSFVLSLYGTTMIWWLHCKDVMYRNTGWWDSTLRSGGTKCSWMVRWGRGWHWRPRGYKLLSHGWSKKCRPGGGKENKEIVSSIEKRYHM